jgi:hypothetical protein
MAEEIRDQKGFQEAGAPARRIDARQRYRTFGERANIIPG